MKKLKEIESLIKEKDRFVIAKMISTEIFSPEGRKYCYFLINHIILNYFIDCKSITEKQIQVFKEVIFIFTFTCQKK